MEDYYEDYNYDDYYGDDASDDYYGEHPDYGYGAQSPEDFKSMKALIDKKIKQESKMKRKGLIDKEASFYPPRRSELARYKTQYCRNSKKNNGFCPIGKKCKFAHSKDEKRDFDDPVPLSAINNYTEEELKGINLTDIYYNAFRSESGGSSSEAKPKPKSKPAAMQKPKPVHSQNLSKLSCNVDDLNDKLEWKEIKIKHQEKELKDKEDIITTLKSDLETAKTELEGANRKNKKLNTELDEAYKLIDRLQVNKEALVNKHFRQERAKVELEQKEYKKLFDYTLQKLNSMLICPVMLERMDSPAILESGNTIEESFLQKLVSSKGTDPFDRSKKCKKVIINRLGRDLVDLVKDIEHKIDEIKPVERKSATTQANFEPQTQVKTPSPSPPPASIPIKYDIVSQKLQDMTYKYNMIKSSHKESIKKLAEINIKMEEKQHYIRHLENSMQKTMHNSHRYEMDHFEGIERNYQMHKAVLQTKVELCLHLLRFMFTHSGNVTVSLVCLALWEKMVAKLLFMMYKLQKWQVRKPDLAMEGWRGDRKQEKMAMPAFMSM